MKPGLRNRTARPDRHGAFAPIWALLLAILFYGAQLGPEVLDGLVHLENRATRHPAGAHFEDPGQQSHSDHCLLTQARGESRALPSLFAEPPRSAAAASEPVIARGERSVPLLSSTSQARAPPVIADS
jgi:hypothetical protein